MKKNSSSGDSQVKWRSLSVAALLIIVVLLSAGSGLYAGASFFAQQANVTITTTTTIYTTSWTTSTIWSTVTSVVYGVWTTVQYTTSTSTVTVTSSTSSRTGTFGTTSNSGSVGGLANYIFATKYTLSQAGTVVSVSVYSLNAGHVKAGIYADSGGVPGSLLAANNAATTVTAGQWTTISIGPVGLTVGTYWIAFNEDANSLRIYKAGIARQAAYMPYAFSNNMPTTWSVNGYWNFDYICYATYTY